jgi:two-component system CitB family sensor kinase
MRFATRVMLVQLATVAVVVAACVLVFVLLGIQQLRAAAETSALNIARTVAVDPQVRARWPRSAPIPEHPRRGLRTLRCRIWPPTSPRAPAPCSS